MIFDTEYENISKMAIANITRDNFIRFSSVVKKLRKWWTDSGCPSHNGPPCMKWG